MYNPKVLVGFVLVCYVLFAVFEFSGNEMMALYFHSLIVPVITIFYIVLVKPKSKLFLLFLVFYSLADILTIVIGNLPFEESSQLNDFEYYVGNSLYIFSYMFLILKIGKSINFKHVVKYLKIHVLVLTFLNFYLLYVLHKIINPNLLYESDFYLELTYNIMILTLLSISLLNYFCRDNKKSLYFFLGALCIVFSEIMDIAFIFFVQRSILNFIATTLTLAAFYFFYQQSKLLNVANNENGFSVIE